MRFERKHAYLLLGVTAWTVLSFSMFARQLAAAYSGGEERPAGYYVAHTVLIIVNFAIAAALGSLGWKALKSTRT